MSIYTKCANMQNMYRSKNVRCAELLVDDWIFFSGFLQQSKNMLHRLISD